MTNEALFGQMTVKIKEMFMLVLEMARDAISGFHQGEIKILDEVLKKEQQVNLLEKEITQLLVDLAKEVKGTPLAQRVNKLFQVVSNTERIGDHLEDIVERIEIKIREELKFSEPARKELDNLFGTVQEVLSDCAKVLETEDKALAQKILSKKTKVENLAEEYKQHHIERLTQGICDYRVGMVFSDIIGILGGINKHACRIVEMWLT